MSDDESSGSSSDGEDIATTGLIATRAKRSTAGNVYASLRQILDDEELQKELLGEEEDDQGDFVGSDKDDDDAMSSSGDEDDAGPPQAGDKEDLEGEKELKKQERLQLKRKRKMDEARMRLPAFQKKKKVKLADDVKTEDGSAAPVERPKKKSERQNWLPTAEDAPIRQSSRSTAVANREMVHSNLKESIKRSEKQKKVMANHAARLKASARAVLTQEERYAKAARIEKETAKDFGRWEREEAERQRLREEALAAKRKRGIDGPVIRHWSGSVLWEGEKIKDGRLHGSQKVEEIKDRPGSAGGEGVAGHAEAVADSGSGQSTAYATANGTPAPPSVPATPGFAGSRPLQSVAPAPSPAPAAAPESWLRGIHEYANDSGASTPGQPSLYTPSTPAINTPQQTLNGFPALAPQPSANHFTPNQPAVYHGLPPHGGYNQFQLNTPSQQTPPVPVVPLIKQQAQRSLIMLEAFESLEVTTTSKRATSKVSKENPLEPTAVASTLLPLSYPTFTHEQARYLTHKKRSTAKDPLPPPPVKERCALTPFPAKFRDPKTGLAYTGLMEYKMIQRLLAGGCQWSSVLGSWVGPAYGDMGRPARGVPEGFGLPVLGKGEEKEDAEDAEGGETSG
ncbi:Putative Vps72/YL1 family protein [Septoria linicola]|uniref:Vps72/YL1 family protein n=1 Tax=Septoria linicola TaxID=215465 RepID=A0A9Q9EIH3_9PEZI|nr:Putative Vps72/YL1 family protein [Septoria linicola]